MVIQCDTVVRSLSILPLASLSLSVCSAGRLSHTGFSRWAKCVKGELLNSGSALNVVGGDVPSGVIDKRSERVGRGVGVHHGRGGLGWRAGSWWNG